VIDWLRISNIIYSNSYLEISIVGIKKPGPAN
jgi:hypothetical protein